MYINRSKRFLSINKLSSRDSFHISLSLDRNIESVQDHGIVYMRDRRCVKYRLTGTTQAITEPVVFCSQEYDFSRSQPYEYEGKIA